MTVAVASWLQPFVQFLVMCQQYMGACRIDDPGAAGDMPGPAITLETTLLSTHEFDEAVSDGQFLRPPRAVRFEIIDEFVSMHAVAMLTDLYMLSDLQGENTK